MFLKAENRNWGLSGAQSWKCTEYELEQNGELHIKVFFLHPVVDTTVQISQEDMEMISGSVKEVIADPPEEKLRALDGEAWSFEQYDDSGRSVFRWEINHIYGIDPLENIGKILKSYIPKYERPNYTSEDIEQYQKEFLLHPERFEK